MITPRAVAFTLISAVLLTSCATTDNDEPVRNGEKKAATRAAISIAEARIIESECPTLQLNHQKHLGVAVLYPVLAQPRYKASFANHIDLDAVIAETMSYKDSVGLRGASQEKWCQFGADQMRKETDAGQFLIRRPAGSKSPVLRKTGAYSLL
ncbi:hypothetical protein [Ensifer sp.]|uniref:hypothetical protein n=1 Tax=Ensifer sp. TaxID=1872086 RepID=UPI00289A0D1D|nr:hypothetical protein [Ensifer sp.]